MTLPLTPVTPASLSLVAGSVNQLAFQEIHALRLINVQDYGAAGDAVTDDTAAIQAAANLLMTNQRGVLFFPPGRYKVSSTITITASNTTGEAMLISGYGAQLVCASVASGPVLKLTCGTQTWRNWILEGLRFYCLNTGAADIIRVEDGTSPGFMYGFKIRDVVMEGGSHSANGLHLAALTGGGLFEYQVDNVKVDFTGNTSGYCVWLDVASGAPAGSSSVDFYALETRGGLNGLRIGSSAVPTRANVIGGTFLSADANGIVAYLQGGNILHPHVESTSSGAANLAAGGGGVYLEGWANVVGLEDVRGGSSKQKWALDVFASGPTNVVGMTSSSTNPFVRVRSSVNTGVVNLVGVPASEVDVSALTAGAASPQVQLAGPTGRRTLTYGATVATDAAKGSHFILSVTNGTAFTMSNPTNLIAGQEITYMISNASGGVMGAITWAANFNLAGAFTNPAAGKLRQITFLAYDGSNLFEKSRTAADI